MALFRRGGKDPAPEDTVETEVDESTVVDDEPELDDAAEVSPPRSQRTGGPWDASQVDDDLPRVDLGAILLPGVQGMELRMEIDKATNVVSAASILLDGSSLQVQAFAAPRTEGIWDEIRAEIAESVTQQGGSADDLPGPFGRELLARLPVRTPEGRTGHRPARFVGADGPRWFVRGVITGRAAVDPAAADGARAALRRDRRRPRHRRPPAPRPAHAARCPDRARRTSRPPAPAPTRRAGGARLRPADPRSGDHGDPMSLKERLKKAVASQAEIEADEERADAHRSVGCTPGRPAGATARAPASPASSGRSRCGRARASRPWRPSCTTAAARWTWSGSVAARSRGVTPGRRLKIEGLVCLIDGRRTVFNPRYELRPRPGE